MKFLQSKNGMERASFDAVWSHLPCLLFCKKRKYFKNHVKICSQTVLYR